MTDSFHPAWNELLAWLDIPQPPVVPRSADRAGYALVANEPIKANRPLFTIEASKVLNVKTLTPLYPGHALSATQLISLHLLLHHPDKGASPDPKFGPYIATLPRDFAFHPLTWAVNESELVEYLPPSHADALKALLARYYTDRVAVLGYLERSQQLEDDLDVSKYLWSWLCVNTRCIFHHLKKTRSDPDNLSLVPILDFANHSSILPSMMPSAASAHTKPQHGGIGSFTLFGPADVGTKANEELFLRYGAHCNRVLFIEYGFILPEAEQPSREIEVDDLVEILFRDRGDAGTWAKEVLDENNYWKDYTLHEAYPSYRLITALRLYAMLPGSGGIPQDRDTFLASWNAVVSGQQDCLSAENENLWIRVLDDEICRTVITRAEMGIARLDDKLGDDVNTVRALWKEELQIAESIRIKITSGESFH
ncbi:hypothetical protein VNI00_003379 [Paramarasmius palmivorus]|uniref:SET domain-containing protein n=1 Tax=Paramarasmius palmivorus TaxID=297713 RepID=A0AAW0DPJ6_9AGAR